MQISQAGVERAIRGWSAPLNAGRLEIYDGLAPTLVSDDASFQTLLVALPLESPWYEINAAGILIALGFPVTAQIQMTGDAKWARLVTASGEVEALLSVGTAADDPVPDVVLDRLDLQRGGLCTLDHLRLTLPAES